jgi:hypothetical protein
MSNGSYGGLGKKRRMVGLTQHELARLTGIPVSRIVFVETGRLDLEPDEPPRAQTAGASGSEGHRGGA